MKSHGLDMQGPLIIERLQFLPDWDINFIGRVVYQLSDGFLYLAASVGWIKLISENDIQTNVLQRHYVSSIDASATGLYSIFDVPSGQMFIANTFEVIIEDILGVGIMPCVSFGTLTNPDLFVSNEILKINATHYERQLWDKPFGPALQGTKFVFSISQAATQTALVLCAVVTGYSIPFTDLGPSEPDKAYRLLYRNEEYSW